MHCLCAEVWFWGEPVLILILELFKCRSKNCSNKGITAGWTVTIFFYSVTLTCHSLTCQKEKKPTTNNQRWHIMNTLLVQILYRCCNNIHSSIVNCCLSNTGSWGCWSLCLLPMGKSQATSLWSCQVSLTHRDKQPQTRTFTPEVNLKSPNLDVFGLRQEARVPAGNPHRKALKKPTKTTAAPWRPCNNIAIVDSLHCNKGVIRISYP